MNFPSVRIVGQHFRGPEVVALTNTYEPGKALALEREPENAHDAYAIRVLDGTLHVGYVERGSAAWIAPRLDEGLEVESCTVESLEPMARGNNLQPIVTITLRG